jgi:hypothetical protein
VDQELDFLDVVLEAVRMLDHCLATS